MKSTEDAMDDDEVRAALEWLRWLSQSVVAGRGHAATIIAHLDGEPERLEAERKKMADALVFMSRGALVRESSSGVDIIVCKTDELLAAKAEEVREACARAVEPSYDEACTRETDERWSKEREESFLKRERAAEGIRATLVTATPLADEIRTLRADLDVAESRKSQAIHDLHARAEKAEARVRELEERLHPDNSFYVETLRLQDELKEAEAERDTLRAQVEAARTYSSFMSAPCPLCTYQNGKFIASCRPHEEADELRAQVERVRAWAAKHAEHPHAWGVLDALEGVKS